MKLPLDTDGFLWRVSYRLDRWPRQNRSSYTEGAVDPNLEQRTLLESTAPKELVKAKVIRDN